MTTSSEPKAPRIVRLELSSADPDQRALFDVRNRWGLWIEETLCCPFDDLIVLEYPFPFEQYLAAELLREHADHSTRRIATQLKDGWIRGFLLPPETEVHFLLSLGSACDPQQTLSGELAWSANLAGPLVAGWIFEGVAHPLVSVNTRLQEADDWNTENARATWILCPRKSAAAVAGLLLRCRKALLEQRGKIIHMVGGPDVELPTTGLDWDDMILPETVVRPLQADLKLLFENGDWYRSRGLPLRRGYLIYGPPGNGKTSLLRTLACSHSALSAYSIEPTLVVKRPDTLVELFARAARNAPALVLLEDVEKWLLRHPTNETSSSLLPTILNLLDGLDSRSRNGLIVACTCNSLTGFPDALRRPGRFDRVLDLPRPDATLRARFFQRLGGTILQGDDLDIIAARTDGLSFAALRECWLQAGALAASDQKEITRDGLLAAAGTIRRQVRRFEKAAAGKSLGFGPGLAEWAEEDVPF